MQKITNIFKGRSTRHFKSCVSALSLLIMVSTGASLAFAAYDGYQDVPPLKVKTVALSSQLDYEPSSAVTDSCLPLLKTIQKTSSQSVVDRNQRSAGKEAAPVVALGLIFGVRYALTPPSSASAYKAKTSENQGNFDVWHEDGSTVKDDRSAQAVLAYRNCQKQQALNAISDFRWSR